MTGPMFQVGWASACSGVTSVSSSRRRPRNGPPLAVRISRRTSAAAARAQALGQRRVLGVDRHDLVRPLQGRPDQRAAGDQRLLVGQRERAAGAQRGQRGREPERPDDAVEHDVARPLGQLGHRLRPGEDLRDLELTRGVAAPRRLGVEGQLQVLGGGGPGHADHVDAQLQRLLGEQARRCRRRRRARRPGTGPGCGARCRPPGCRSTRSTRAARSRARSRRPLSPSRPSRTPPGEFGLHPDRHNFGEVVATGGRGG